jgi:hypothetical protein
MRRTACPLDFVAVLLWAVSEIEIKIETEINNNAKGRGRVRPRYIVTEG